MSERPRDVRLLDTAEHYVPSSNSTAIVPRLQTLSAKELLQMSVPPRTYALEPILPFPGLAMIYAPRGLGKTYLALSVSYAIAIGGRALRWNAPKALRVLHVDGEMPVAVNRPGFAGGCFA